MGLIDARDVTIEFDLPQKGGNWVFFWQFSLSIERGQFDQGLFGR